VYPTESVEQATEQVGTARGREREDHRITKITGLPRESHRALIRNESMLTTVTVFELGFPMNENVLVTAPVVTVALDVSSSLPWRRHGSSWMPACRILNVRFAYGDRGRHGGRMRCSRSERRRVRW
jgi:hypothetical protein